MPDLDVGKLVLALCTLSLLALVLGFAGEWAYQHWLRR
jgi:hypothetical protein